MERGSSAARRRFRPAIALVGGCLASLALAPMAQASSTGAITGTVEHAAKPLERIEVSAYKPGYGGEYVEEVKTNASGEYTLSSLAPGAYVVEFAPEREEGYAPQYYPDKPSYEGAQTVEVKAEQTQSGIDAELHVGGEITGKVTDNLGVPVKEAHVEASGTNAAGEPVYGGSAETTSSGEYTLAGLADGKYRVSFEAPFGVNLVSQYFEGAHSEAGATLVKVEEEEGGPGQEVNAKLEVGGKIAGTVTDAVTHKPLADIVVYAYSPGGGFPRYGETNASGEYSIVGLEGGSTYDLSFFEESEFFEEGTGLYVEQFDENVGVTKEATTSVNAAMVPDVPTNVGAPTVAGAPLVGHALSCSTGTWIGVTPFKYAYRWLRDGSAITGASAPTYAVQTSDQGHSISCEVTATNASGRGVALSNALRVAPAPVVSVPPSLPPVPAVTIASYRLLAHGRAARVHLNCKAASCLGAVELSEQIVVKHRKGRRTISRRKKVVLATGSYSLAAGHSGTFIVHLTKLGKRLLAHAKHHRIAATLVVTVVGGLPARGAVLLKVL